MESLGRRVGWVSLGRLVGTLNLVLIEAILARNLTSEAYGQYQQVWMLLNICIPLFLFGLPLSISYFLPALKDEDRDRVLYQHVMWACGAAVLFCGALFGGAPVLARLLGSPQLVPLLRLGSVVGAGLVATGFWEPFLIVYNRHRWVTLSLVGFAVVYLGAVVAGCFLGGSVRAIFLSLWVLAACRVLVAAVALRTLAGRPRLPAHQGWLLRQGRYMLPIGARDSLGILARFVDKILVNLQVGAGEFAYYYNGARELPLVGLVVDATLSVLLPDFAASYHRGQTTRIAALMRRAACAIGLLVIPAAAFSWATAPEIMALLYGETYRASSAYFRIFTLLLPVRVSTAGPVLLAAGRPHIVLLGTALDLLLAFGLGWALLPWLGLKGPAAALVFSTYCQVAYNTWQASRAINMPLRQLMPWRSLIRVLAFSAVLAVAATWSQAFSRPIANLAAAAAVSAALYAAAAASGWLLSDDEQAALRAAWQRFTGRGSAER